MAGVVLRDVQVHRRNIAAQFRSSGQGGRWLKALSYDMKGLAAAEAPKRSFKLAQSHYVSFRRGSNAYSAVTDVENRARHAEWVHEGTPAGAKTKTPYYIHGSPWLYLPAWGEHGRKRLKAVSGQAANPWLERACSQIARSVGAIEVL